MITPAVQHLADAWAADREGMDDIDREALLEHVRERLDTMPRLLRSHLGVEYGPDNLRGYMVVGMFFDLMLPLADAEALLEAAC